MRPKLLLAALAAAITFTAMPASAQWYGRDRGDFRGRGGDIVVRHDAGTFRFDRGDREYWRLTRNFGFRPGRTYVYTHDCNARGCDVLVYRPDSRRAVARMHAPYFRFAFAGNRVPGRYADRDRDRDWGRRG
jgi:hypothetical protein